jgi:hypothetical protein
MRGNTGAIGFTPGLESVGATGLDARVISAPANFRAQDNPLVQSLRQTSDRFCLFRFVYCRYDMLQILLVLHNIVQ